MSSKTQQHPVMSVRTIYIVLCVCLCHVSCKEGEKIEAQSIVGTWEVFAAKRNQRSTTTLRDAYFRFEDAGSMRTNILGEDVALTYTLDENVIRQRGDGPRVDYEIVQLEGDTLHLRAVIRNHRFDFYTRRQLHESE